MLMVLLGSTWSRTSAFQSVPLSHTTLRQQPYRSGVIRQRLFGSTSRAAATSASTDAADPVALESTQSALYLPGRPDFAIRTIMAPMVASSDYAYRCLCRQYGSDLTYTQMLHSRNLMTDKTFWKNHLDLYECDSPDTISAHQRSLSKEQTDLLMQTGTSGESPADRQRFGNNGDNDSIDMDNHNDAPLMVQLAGHDVDTVVAAAQKILEHTNGRLGGFDLNLGCPQGIARKGRYGAFLMEQEEDTVCQILAALRKAVPKEVAISAKIRLPLTDELLINRIPRLLDTGIDFMTVHGRTLHENKTKVAGCHTDRLRLAVETAQKHTPGFPVVANGGVEHYPDVDKLRLSTGAVAVMSSEALLERPNLFTVDSSEYTPRQVLNQQFQFASDYLGWCRLYPPLPGVVGTTHGSFNIIKGHLFKFLHRYLQEHPDARDALSDHQHMTSVAQAQIWLDELYARYEGKLMNGDEDEYHTTSSTSTSSSSSSSSSSLFLSNTSWYRRHRKADGERSHQRPVRIGSDLMGNHEEVVVVSVADRKRMAKERIAKLQLEKQRVGMKNL
jgi:tRNA-dihydrouridine synthase